ncbi:MmgE/PrpD family protein [Alteribacillus sp. JSM 102045]|uniref:MmgE/PrpD family protein n=1 Tax=Alteribacillus sp. JSM 102045 TaxID=1562101 RepID=UPI0035BF4A37
MRLQQKAAKFIAEEGNLLITDNHIQQAKVHILDTVGAALAAHTDPISTTLLDYNDEMDEAGAISIWGTDRKTTLQNAVFINGILCHALDYDDTTWGFMGHPSAVLVPALIGVAEKYGCSGQEVVKGYLIGSEISCRLGEIAKPNLYKNGWHATSAVGVLGATAAIGHLLKLNIQKMTHALGIGATSAFGLRSNFGSMTKPFHVGLAAQAGVRAALLAKNGFTSSEEALDGKMGYYANFSNKEHEELANVTFGKPFDIEQNGFFVKPYPSCAATHSAIDAILSLIEEGDLTPDKVKKIRAGSGPVAPLMLIYDRPTKGFEGKFSMPFILSAALHDRKIGIETFTDGKVNDTSIKELMNKVECYIHDNYKDYTIDKTPANIEVEMEDGTTAVKIVNSPSGSPEKPLTTDRLQQKYIDCARRVLSDEKVQNSYDLLQRLDTVKNIKAITEELSTIRTVV